MGKVPPRLSLSDVSPSPLFHADRQNTEEACHVVYKKKKKSIRHHRHTINRESGTVRNKEIYRLTKLPVSIKNSFIKLIINCALSPHPLHTPKTSIITYHTKNPRRWKRETEKTPTTHRENMFASYYLRQIKKVITRQIGAKKRKNEKKRETRPPIDGFCTKKHTKKLICFSNIHYFPLLLFRSFSRHVADRPLPPTLKKPEKTPKPVGTAHVRTNDNGRKQTQQEDRIPFTHME